MPLIQSKSKKAISKNIEAEMRSGKPHDQAIAVSLETQRRNKRKKMADGGMVNESAKTEQRPMPSETDKDSSMVIRNSAKHPLNQDDQVTGDPTVRQAQSKPRVEPIKHPKMVPSNAFSTRLFNEENDLQSSKPPGPYGAQPPKHDDEIGANRQGPTVSEESKDYRAGYMAGRYAAGGVVESSPQQNVARPDKGWGAIIAKAEGGEVEDIDVDEMADEEHSSIAAAIMAKNNKMAEGGEVDLSRNADEDPNLEDQLSFEALGKENYSESAGLEQLDQPLDSNEMGDEREDAESDPHDMISSIRRKMKTRSPMVR